MGMTATEEIKKELRWKFLSLFCWIELGSVRRKVLLRITYDTCSNNHITHKRRTTTTATNRSFRCKKSLHRRLVLRWIVSSKKQSTQNNAMKTNRSSLQSTRLRLTFIIYFVVLVIKAQSSSSSSLGNTMLLWKQVSDRPQKLWPFQLHSFLQNERFSSHG